MIFASKHILLFILCCLLISGVNVYAQDVPAEETPAEEAGETPEDVELISLPDSLQISPVVREVDEKPSATTTTAAARKVDEVAPKFFSGIDLSFDYPKLAGILLPFETKYEGALGLIFLNRFSLSVEGGSAVLAPENAYKNDSIYESRGDYGRIGLDYIFSFEDNTAIFLGGRLGMSRFSEMAVFQIGNVFGNEEIFQFSRQNLSAYWYEIVIGTETSIFHNLYLGGMFRFRILGGRDRFEDFDVYSIPGYGRGFDRTIPALNLFFKYKFRW